MQDALVAELLIGGAGRDSRSGSNGLLLPLLRRHHLRRGMQRLVHAGDPCSAREAGQARLDESNVVAHPLKQRLPVMRQRLRCTARR